ncbi:heavy-metal-associated domain-containing protein [Pararhodobacter sp.]|uniref:heavy-metal-associated domain-containing protein n=1 Tax=Pararhodobacter sp. TaxID=2127056 RepID=UPI002AFE2C85|nr:cation transporter [Pararhodobacter sp.]
MTAPIILAVPDMSCGHCRASITKALAPLGVDPAFDMETRRVTITADIAADTAIAALDKIGFDATQVTD